MRSAARSFDDVDVVELRSVGVDVGSSTSHLAFSRVRLERLATALSSRFTVTERVELWRSPIMLTPYLDRGDRIDADALESFVTDCENAAGVTFDDLDTGAVLLTGTALERPNARAVAEAVAKDAGRFVCAAAGHHFEAELAAQGSGAPALSVESGSAVLAVDLGGGTAKFARCEDGAIVSTAALAIGGRLLVLDEERRMLRVERSADAVAADIGERLEVGAVLSYELEVRLVARMADVLVGVVLAEPEEDLTRRLWLTEPQPVPAAPIVTFTGGVAEYLEGRERRDFFDIGRSLARAIRAALEVSRDPPKVVPAAELIRATVIGASQFSVQVTGSTVLVAEETALPVHGIPVVRPDLDLSRGPERALVTDAVRRAASRRLEAIAAAGALATTFSWSGDPSYARLRALADGIADAVRAGAIGAAKLLVVVVDRDLGASIGRVLRDDVGLRSPVVVVLDGLDLGELDFIDLGARREPSGVVPAVVKSLLFAK